MGQIEALVIAKKVFEKLDYAIIEVNFIGGTIKTGKNLHLI